MTYTITIDEIDFGSLTEDDQRAIHALVVARGLEEDPDDTPTHFQDLVVDWTAFREFRRTRRWIARAGNDAIGFGQLGLNLADNLDIADVAVFVRADGRRAGAGRALIRTAVTAAQDVGRTRVFAAAEEKSSGVPFLESLGMVRGIVNHRNRLMMGELDGALLEGWVDRAAERAHGYSLVSWDNATPPEHIAAFCRVNDVMNTAPRDDLEVEDEVMTPEILADYERVRLEMGDDWWTLCARHDATGEFVGFTELFFSPWYRDKSWQGNTGVDPGHRNVGLGRWLKAANLLRLMDDKPEVASVDTHNAGSNDAMLSINHTLGFRPSAIFNVYSASLELVAKALA